MEWVARTWTWFEQHPQVVWGITGASIVLLLIGLLALPLVLIRIPADYFVREHHEDATHLVLRVLRNLLGAVVLLAGIAMLALPGQGLLTVLAGLLLLDFPGKRRLELELIRREGVRNGVDWIRRKGGKAPLQLPEA